MIKAGAQAVKWKGGRKCCLFFAAHEARSNPRHGASWIDSPIRASNGRYKVQGPFRLRRKNLWRCEALEKAATLRLLLEGIPARSQKNNAIDFDPHHWNWAGPFCTGKFGH